MTREQLTQIDWVRDAMARYETPLIRYAQRFTGRLELAQDVVQDTFIKLCTAYQAQLDGHLAPWLYRVCRNRALDVMKKEQRMQPLSEERMALEPSTAAPPNVHAENQETGAIIQDAIRQLPDPQEEAFRLKFQDRLSYKEISAVTGLTTNQVRYHIHSALKTLRQQLQGQLDLAAEL